MVDGVHYLELIEPIKQLKREGRNEEVLILCYKAIQAAEGDAGGREPAPWYTEQAAIVHRKLGQKKEEIAVLGGGCSAVRRPAVSEAALENGSPNWKPAEMTMPSSFEVP